MMEKIIVFAILYLHNVFFVSPSFVFHENTRIKFTPNDRNMLNEYFGYSTLLTPERLYIGAPKATLNQDTGVVFSCSLQNLDKKEVACEHLGSKYGGSQLFMPFDMRRDMWFGSSLALLPKDRLLVTAPRAQTHWDSMHVLMHGAFYCLSARRARILDPLSDGTIDNQVFRVDGRRQEYGPKGLTLFYYAQGQAGFSLAVTKLNTIIVGAPGFLQWTGGVITYTFNPNETTPYMKQQLIGNPYYTMDLGPDDYFGYSVESGVFDKNGSVFYVAGAPRSNLGSGKVLVFLTPKHEYDPLDIKAKILGPKAGSYFGASLCCLDINQDGLEDILVGAPTFVNSNDSIHYDQGAVYVYITKETSSGLHFEETGFVYGSGSDGAKFGTAIADLGDVNGDGYRDVAIGAPWEDNGRGAVYIYMGYSRGLNKENVQRIQSSNDYGFGWSIAKGLDIDNNICNDVAIGAINSRTSYVYRCIPTMIVHTSISIPTAINLPHNETTFTAMFCVSARPIKFKPDVKLNLIASIQVDPEDKRAIIVEDSSYSITATPESEVCDQRTIFVNETADLRKPLVIKFDLKTDELMKDDSTSFLMEAARLSEESKLNTSFHVQLMRDCGEDLFCSPWLQMTLEALNNPYVPGSNETFGINLSVINKAEPAYDLKVNITLPMQPKRIPGDCSLQNLTMTCGFPQPFSRNEIITWQIELDYNLKVTKDIDLKVTAELSDLDIQNISQESVKTILLKITPEATFGVSGKSVPNATINVLRDSLSAGAGVSFKHYFEITNLGPSDWDSLAVQLIIPKRSNISKPIKGCKEAETGFECLWSIPAMVSHLISIPLVFDLNVQGEFLTNNVTYNATTSILISTKSELKHMEFEVTTTLILEPASIILYIIIPCIFVGLFLLGIIVWILHKRGFFVRKMHEIVQQETETCQQLLEHITVSDDDENERTESIEDDL